MKSFKYLGFSLLALITSCSSEEKTENAENQNTELNDESVSKTKVFLDANLATVEQMEQAYITDGEIMKILENRPFESMEQVFKQLDGTDQEVAEKMKMLFIPVNLNTATEKDFLLIPGVGEKMAHEFMEYRPYTSIKQFRREMSKYVDEAEIKRYETFVFVPVELNSASEEDIMALPGVGKKMTHEFLEYRPYKNMEQFRKEIGKYVDEKELKRLEGFVYIK